MKYLQLTFFLLISFFHFCQKGEIKIVADSRIDQLVKKQGTAIPPAVNPQIYGYRVQIYFESDKKLVNEMQIKFLEISKNDKYSFQLQRYKSFYFRNFKNELRLK